MSTAFPTHVTAFAGSGATPGDPWRSQAARIVRITDEAPGVRTYDLEIVDPAARAAFRFSAGQFNMLHVPGIGEAAISIASDPDSPGTLAHTVRAVGNVTNALARLGCAREVLFRGPFGRPWPLDPPPAGDLVIVGGGVGLASQRAAIRRVIRRRARHQGVAVLHGAKVSADLLYRHEYAAWRDAGVDVRTVVARADAGWTGHVGLVTDLLAHVVRDPAATTLFCCGPEPMLTAVAREAGRLGVGPERVFVSLERTMACGIGQCGLCQLGPFVLCQDGPVIRYDRVARFLAVAAL
ncbi:MAG: FAD/NAD(P)-binding protein [Planctomycetia bacterium]